ncbi:hypothetical protein BGW36DRAFT_293006 [Talaromyces proteolyticus]|uniref:N-acetyltransferase domain-containing protein n=1 Tax=Talaromyces proteolyticus TaxID=1131652 RepID=A0AAD4KY06_9EURO|nr:uncharacterized protein BGW36DRAFT_293006 [Talaromyces proteolyticus]KAH8700106.1 hypothetical protein BGW36DRAFT_293006 [Talaromyces proteolyticus]
MLPRINVTTNIVAVADVLTRSFSDSPVTAYVLHNKDSTWHAPIIPLDILQPKMVEWTTYKAKIGGELVEAGDYAAAAIWFPPGVDLPASSDDDERLVEYRKTSGKLKKEFLKGRQYWYLNMIGRHPERSDPGVIRALFEPYIERAHEQKVPIWLEAVSDHSRQVYEHFGFKTVATFRIGLGKVTPRGELQEGGEGIPLYAMILE